MHNRSVETVLKRPKGSRDKVPIPCPPAIRDYNQFMGGVDHSFENGRTSLQRTKHLNFYCPLLRGFTEFHTDCSMHTPGVPGKIGKLSCLHSK